MRDVEKLFQTRFHTILVPTLAQWVPSLAAHDDNHLAQMERALERAP